MLDLHLSSLFLGVFPKIGTDLRRRLEARSQPMKRLGEILTDLGWISDDDLRAGLEAQQREGGRLGTCLLELGSISELRLLSALSYQLGVPAALAEDLVNIPSEVHRLVPSRLALRWTALPFRMLGDELHVAMLDPTHLGHQDELAFATSKQIRAHTGNEARIVLALERYFGSPVVPRFQRLVERLDATDVPSNDDWQTTPEPVEDDRDLGDRDLGDLGDLTLIGPDSTMPSRLLEGGVTAKLAGASPSTSSPAADTGFPAADTDVTPPAVTHEGPQQARGPTSEPDERPRPRLVITAARGQLRSGGAARSPDAIATSLLVALRQHFDRVIAFKVLNGKALGWCGNGRGIETSPLMVLSVDLGEPSVLHNLAMGAACHMGPVPPMPAHRAIAAVWGAGAIGDCLVLPLRVQRRLLSIVLCERSPERIAATPLALPEIASLVTSATEELERCILRHKLARAEQQRAQPTSIVEARQNRRGIREGAREQRPSTSPSADRDPRERDPRERDPRERDPRERDPRDTAEVPVFVGMPAPSLKESP
jgi:hypothetical protein